MLRKDLDCGIKSWELVTKCSKIVEGGSVEAKTAGVPSKPGKDQIESFTRQGGSLGSRFTFLATTS